MAFGGQGLVHRHWFPGAQRALSPLHPGKKEEEKDDVREELMLQDDDIRDDERLRADMEALREESFDAELREEDSLRH